MDRLYDDYGHRRVVLNPSIRKLQPLSNNNDLSTQTAPFVATTRVLLHLCILQYALLGLAFCTGSANVFRYLNMAVVGLQLCTFLCMAVIHQKRDLPQLCIFAKSMTTVMIQGLAYVVIHETLHGVDWAMWTGSVQFLLGRWYKYIPYVEALILVVNITYQPDLVCLVASVGCCFYGALYNHTILMFCAGVIFYVNTGWFAQKKKRMTLLHKDIMNANNIVLPMCVFLCWGACCLYAYLPLPVTQTAQSKHAFMRAWQLWGGNVDNTTASHYYIYQGYLAFQKVYTQPEKVGFFQGWCKSFGQ